MTPPPLTTTPTKLMIAEFTCVSEEPQPARRGQDDRFCGAARIGASASLHERCRL
jgi:hypothetical protein